MKPRAANYLRILIRGQQIERFLNMVSFHGIALYRIIKKEDSAEATVEASAFRELFYLRRKTGVTLSVLERHGPYYLWKKTRHRRLGILCGILCFSSLYVMSLFVWDISFEGNLRYTDSYLLDYVLRDGYRPGMLISQLSCDLLEKDLRNSFQDITWVSARVEGTRLVVEIEENSTAGGIPEDEPPCSLIAEKSGVVQSIVTRQGTPQVQAGDVVEEGQLLVSGYVPIVDDSGTVIAYTVTSASADVRIAYEEEYSVEIPRTQTVRRYTSDRVRPGLVLFGHRFCLPGSLGDGEGELYIQQTQWKLFDNFYLPFYTESYEYRTYEEAEISYDDESLYRQAQEKYLEFLLDLDKLGVEIIENDVTIENGAQSCVMAGTLLLEKNAAEKAPLENQEQN